jgi:hypothetical protein
VTPAKIANLTSTTSPTTTQPLATWTATPLKFAASSLACVSKSTCLAVGHFANGLAAMAQWHSPSARNVTLSYVPSPLTGVACQPSACVAIAPSTVVALQP